MARQPGEIKIKRSGENNEFYAGLFAANGKQIWRTSETYKRKEGARKALQIGGNVFLAYIQTKIDVIDETL